MSRYFWNKNDCLLPSYILIDGRNKSIPGPPGPNMTATGSSPTTYNPPQIFVGVALY